MSKQNTMLNRNILLVLTLIALINISCKKLVDVNVPNSRLIKKSVYNNNQTAISLVNQIFDNIESSGTYSIGGIPLLTGLSADEIIYSFVTSDQVLGSYYQNTLSAQTIGSASLWSNSYKNLFNINDAIEGISQSTDLTSKVKQQLLGEAKFMRAFCYFYLVNTYGEVPLILSTDYEKNATMSKTSKDEIWKAIILDLTESYNNLSDEFLDGTLLSPSTERVRPTKWSAAALLARSYLYTNNWKLAEEKSDEVIKNKNLFQLDSLENVFLKNSTESILQFQPTTINLNTWIGQYFTMPDSIGVSIFQPCYLSRHLLESFEPNDQRKIKWIGFSTTPAPNSITYAYPSKYKQYKNISASDPLTEYYTVFRLSEQYLIRAEARVRQNNLNGALEDIKVIRYRAHLPQTKALSQPEILNAILHERQVELFVEWGDRWFDLKRLNKIDDIMESVAKEKGGKWSNYRQYFPIDLAELRLNPNLVQNEGY